MFPLIHFISLLILLGVFLFIFNKSMKPKEIIETPIIVQSEPLYYPNWYGYRNIPHYHHNRRPRPPIRRRR